MSEFELRVLGRKRKDTEGPSRTGHNKTITLVAGLAPSRACGPDRPTTGQLAERTVAGLMRALDACAHIFKPAKCTNYFAACGYDTT